MSLKEIGKEVAKAGMEALLFNPIALLVLIIGAFIFLSVGIGVIIYYGLTTAVVLFTISTIGVLILHYTKAVNLSEQPLIAALPFLMFAVGYFAERLQIFAVYPLWTTQTAITTGTPLPLLILLILLFLAVAIAYHKR